MTRQISNIGAEGQRKKVRGGVIALTLGVAVAVVLIVADVSRWWRLGLFLPFWPGTLGVFQGLEKTWVFLAARGLRDMGGEEEEIEDPEELVQVRRQARRVHIESVLAAVLLTGIAVAVPW